ncbi:MAG: hypothetical protein HY974_04625 [Candidatus Kerfeldbacteria bacterium]|nr:hypothetical protein [Candidatus Kerfeldbacteria bacterium]
MAEVQVTAGLLVRKTPAPSPCLFHEECTFYSSDGTNGCNTPGTKHSECAFYHRLEERQHYVALCVVCGSVELNDGTWVAPLGGRLLFEPDSNGVYAWRYRNGLLVGNLGGVFCPDCRPHK